MSEKTIEDIKHYSYCAEPIVCSYKYLIARVVSAAVSETLLAKTVL